MLGYGILAMHIELDRANSLPEESPVRDAEKRKPCGRFVRLHRPRFAMNRHRIVRAFVRWHTEASQLATYPLFLRSSTHMLDEIQNVCRLRLPHGTRDPWQRLVARDRPGCQHRSFADPGFNANTDPEWFRVASTRPYPFQTSRIVSDALRPLPFRTSRCRTFRRRLCGPGGAMCAKSSKLTACDYCDEVTDP